MTTLYYHQGACSLAPHIVLQWIGAPYNAVEIEFGTEEIRKLNPAGAVPILQEDDGWTLTQADAILEYLVHKHPEADLAGGPSLREQADVNKWGSFITSDLHASFWPIFSPGRFTTDQSQKALDDVAEAAKKTVAGKLKLVDDHLAGREWMAGEGKGKLSFLDAYIFPMLRWAMAKLPNGIDDFPNVKALYERVGANPDVQKVMADEAKGAGK